MTVPILWNRESAGSKLLGASSARRGRVGPEDYVLDIGL
jgi:hypothetical protein